MCNIYDKENKKVGNKYYGETALNIFRELDNFSRKQKSVFGTIY